MESDSRIRRRCDDNEKFTGNGPYAGEPLRLRIERSGYSISRVAGLAGVNPRHVFENRLYPTEREAIERVLAALKSGEIPTFPDHRRGFRSDLVGAER